MGKPGNTGLLLPMLLGAPTARTTPEVRETEIEIEEFYIDREVLYRYIKMTVHTCDLWKVPEL